MYYTDFPYGTHTSIEDSYISLVTCYSFVKYNMIGFMADKTDPASLADFISAMFRLIEHSDFTVDAVRLLKAIEFTSPSQLNSLASL